MMNLLDNSVPGIFTRIFLASSILLFLSYWIGYALLWIVNYPDTKKINQTPKSIALLLGLTVQLCLYACIQTNFRTIALGILLVMPLFFFLIRKHKIPDDLKQEERSHPYFFFNIFFAVTFWSVWYTCLYTGRLQPDIIQEGGRDMFFYADVAKYFNLFGSENTHAINNFFVQDLRSTRAPYHYYEIWFSAYLNYFGVGSYPFIFLTILPVTINALLFVVLFDLLKLFFKNNSIHYLLVFILFLNAFYITEFLSNIFIFTVPNNSQYKHSIISLFILAFVLLYQHWKLDALAVLLFLPFLNFLTLPSVMLIFGLYFIYTVYTKQFSPSLFITFIITVLFNIYFYLDAIFHRTVSGGNESSQISLSDPSYYKTSINIIGGTSLQTGYIYLPYILLFLVGFFLLLKRKIFLNRENIILIIILVAGIAGGLLTWALEYPIVDSYQFYTNFGLSAINSLWIFLFLFMLSKLRHLFLYLCTFSLIAINMYKAYTVDFVYNNQTFCSRNFIKSIIAEIGNDNNEKVIYFLKEPSSFYGVREYNTIAFSPLGTIREFRQNTNFVCITVPDTSNLSYDPINKKRIAELIGHSTLPEYQKKSNYSSKQLVKKFTEDFPSNFILTRELNIIPDYLSERISKTYFDKTSKLYFVVLKKN